MGFGSLYFEKKMESKENIRQWLSQNINKHVGANIRNYTYRFYNGACSHNKLGGVNYLTPSEGKVVEVTDTFTLVKTSPNSFDVILNSYLPAGLTVGDKISMKFYRLNRFDGTNADGTEDPAVGNVRTYSLTGTESKFPVKWDGRYLGSVNEKFQDDYTPIQNPYLRDLIDQMEKFPVNGGFRKVVNVLIDANATGLEFIDPTEAKSAEIPPAIKCRVATKKIVGTVSVEYDRATDTYTIRVTPDGKDEEVSDMVHFDELGPQLIELIDDDQWLNVKVIITKKASKKKINSEESALV